ncbi:MAG TPA: 5-(carboxyamino)imidazole ribonucleotide mutase [bacterium]|nr:5-(carboxyamino)imidazole ribonucleotide mutase [bacterium]HEX68437.1 5-(carboxyamino)imidazole ribonucleotide mutase [bacterium]
MKKVAILMGSDNDWEIMKETVRILEEAGVETVIKVTSIHKNPEETIKLVKELEKEVEVIICGAGGAFHLAGVTAGLVSIPVIAVPLALPPFQGWDSLLASLQMPKGIPVGVMSVGKWGAVNGALFALRILGVKYAEIKEKVKKLQEKERENMKEKDKRVRKWKEQKL